MSELSCRICLEKFDDDDDLHSLFEMDDSDESLSLKLQSVGFMKAHLGDELPSHVCGWCASRVQDAYDLKQQCEKADDHLHKKKDAAYEIMHKPMDFQNVCLLSHTSENVPEIINVASRGFSTPFISVILGSAYDMIKCVRNLSSALKFITSLLNKAVHFADNIFSFLAVLSNVKGVSPSLKKSTHSMREEAAYWLRQSVMLNDVSSFLKLLSCSKLLSKDKTVNSDIVGMGAAKVNSLKPKCSSSDKPSASHQEKLKTVSSSELAPDSSSNVSVSRQDLVESQFNQSEKSLIDVPSLSSESLHSVRRSVRSKSAVDHLVYWPPLKKRYRADKSLSSSHKFKTESVLTSVKPSEVLDSLLLKRQADTKSADSSAYEKWTIVQKKKSFIGSQVEKKSEIRSGKIDGLVAYPDEPVTACTSNSLEGNKNSSVVPGLSENPVNLSLRCSVCGKVLSSSRCLKKHQKIHKEPSYKCQFCGKSLSSNWNRAQHERVHTGEKPYRCDICQTSFRYNVSLRHHKFKCHSTAE